jgi:N-acetylneuraminic acid mutarotase
VFTFDILTNNRPLKKRSMMLKRYGHNSVYLNGIVYVIGGFSHRDLPNEMPVTLAACEQFNILENSWTYTSTMMEPRAFAAAVPLDDQFIYVFGGMHDFTVLQTIEKYDTSTDSWQTLFFSLPLPLAKLGAVLVDRASILICGGMSSDFEAKKECFSFELNTTKWMQAADLSCPKLPFSGLISTVTGYVISIGGTLD